MTFLVGSWPDPCGSVAGPVVDSGLARSGAGHRMHRGPAEL